MDHGESKAERVLPRVGSLPDAQVLSGRRITGNGLQPKLPVGCSFDVSVLRGREQ